MWQVDAPQKGLLCPGPWSSATMRIPRRDGASASASGRTQSTRVVSSEAKARWRKAHKFVRLGITEEAFQQLLEAQGHACAMCHELFGEDARIFADHDHTCCPKQIKATARTCGKCIRGLLCFRCNTALGYIELYGERARRYLSRYERAPGRPPGPGASRSG